MSCDWHGPMLESSRGDDVTYYANEATRRDVGGDVAFLITFSEGFGAQFYENEPKKARRSPPKIYVRYQSQQFLQNLPQLYS